MEGHCVLQQYRYYVPVDSTWRSHWFVLGDTVAPSLQGTSPANSVTCSETFGVQIR